MFNTLLSMLTAAPLLLFTTASSGSSWSASLNLLFFYITWSTLLLAHPPLKVELVGSLVVRVLFFWLPALIFLLFDAALPSLARKIKLQGARGVHGGSGGSGRSSGGAHRAKVVGWALFNTLLGVAVQGAVEVLFVRVLHRPTALRISSRLPLPGELLWGVFRGVVMREVRSLFSPSPLTPVPCYPCPLVAGNECERKGRKGKALRLPPSPSERKGEKKTSGAEGRAVGGKLINNQVLYYYIHRFVLHADTAVTAGGWRSILSRGHRTWQHSMTAPWAAVAHYDHPAAYLLARALPCYLPAVAMRFHLLTWFLFLAVVSVEEATAFSGYSSIYSFLGGAAHRIDAHFCSSGLVCCPALVVM